MADTRLANPRPVEIAENASLHNQAVSEKDEVERDSVHEVVHEATSSVRPIHEWKLIFRLLLSRTLGQYRSLAGWAVLFHLDLSALLLPLEAFGLWDVKWLWLASTVVFQTGSVICGGVLNMNALIIGRVITGAGGARIYLGGLNLTAIFTSLEERPLHIALNGMVWGIGTILGLVVGGGFTESDATWRWGYYLNLVIGAAFAPVYLFLVPNFQPDPSRTFVAKLKVMDWLGTLLYAEIYATWIIALTFGSVLWAWNDGRIIALFVVFGFALLTFSATQTFSVLTDNYMRIFPCEFLTDRIMVLLHL
ncbi:major facilitator superfamily domain-containing protein [Bisporella sp. PMI_857]|nr:major facilitator superfamily domain-containing protein [Bisporella sp. PMI_857]